VVVDFVSAVPRRICWRCRRLRSEIQGAACRECRQVIHACYDALVRRGRVVPGDERGIRITLALAAAVAG
jgi:hypothetical protein